VTERSCIAGVDIGTSSAKALVVDPDGRIVASASRDYPLYRSGRHMAEQDPDQILEGVMQSLRTAVGYARRADCLVGGLALSAAMHSLIALNSQGRPMTSSITWADNRAADQAARLRSSNEGPAIYQRTGTPLHAMSPLAKLMWFRDEEPELFGAADRWVSMKEFVLLGMTGELVADHSIASASGLFSLRGLDWDEEVLALVGITPDKLPELVPTTHVVDRLLPDTASYLRLPRGCPVVVGASDGALANIGVGAVHPGALVCSIGTSGAVRATTDRPSTDDAGRLFCYVLGEGRWIVGGPINNGGSALTWARAALFPDLADADDAFAVLDAAAAAVPAGAGGLVFLPYLLGERAPQWDPAARAVFFGLSGLHERNHMLRAVLEGVAMQLNSVLTVVEETMATQFEDVRATGGFARMSSWRRILASVFDRAIRFPTSHESSAWGAAVLGMLALNRIESLDWVVDHVEFEGACEPDPSDAETYARMRDLFVALYGRLKPAYEELAAAQMEA
jgi:gluconokinase